MTKVRLIDLKKARSYAVVLVPEDQVPRVLRRGDHMYAFTHKEGDRMVFEEVEPLDAFTEREIEHGKRIGAVT